MISHPSKNDSPRRSRFNRNLLERLELRLMLATFEPTTAAQFSSALTNAQLGDTIILKAGTTYAGSFRLPNKTTGSGWITIRSSNIDKLPGAGVRVTPPDAPNMARLQSHGYNEAVIKTNLYAHHYQFIGIEFVGPANNANVTTLVEFGSTYEEQSSEAVIPHHIIVDRCYMRPNIPDATIRRAIGLHSAYTDIINSYIEEIHEGSDSNAIAGWNGTGPFNIINNRLEGAGENIMFGGATNRIPGKVSSDILIKGNHIIKPLHWRGKWTVKNLFELKHGARVTLEDNILENCWTSGQTGVAIVLKLGDYDVSPQNVTEDIILRNNIIRNANGAIALQGRDYASNSPEGLVRRITFSNNLFDNINGYWGSSKTGGGTFNIYITHGPKDVTIDHNTFINGYSTIEVDSSNNTYKATNFKFTNNITAHNAYGIRSSDGTGNPTITKYLNDGTQAQREARLTKNILLGGPSGSYTSRPGNYFPSNWDDIGFVDRANHNYRLASTSSYRNAATDGKDLGADIALLETRVAGVANGVFTGWFTTDKTVTPPVTTHYADHFTVRRTGPNNSLLEVSNSAWPITTPGALPQIPFVDNLAFYQSLHFITGNENDTVTIDYTNGSPIPTGTSVTGVTLRGLHFDGGSGNDTLLIPKTGAASYLPSGAVNARGELLLAGGEKVVVNAAESILATSLSGVTLTTANATDNLTLNSSTPGQYVVSGTSTAPAPVGAIGMIPLTLATSAPITLDLAANDAAGGSDVITIPAGSGAVGAIALNAGTGSNTVTVNGGGNVSLNTNLGVGGVNVDLNVNNIGTQVTLPGSQRLRNVTIGNGGKVKLPVDGASTLRAVSLAISGAGSQLDLANNSAVIDYAGASPLGAGTTYTGISKLLRDGRNGGTWNGVGIVTRMTAAIAPNYLTTLGVAEAKDIVGPAGGTWNGQSVDNTALLIKYTYTGDANLSGSLDGDDYFLLDAGYSADSKGFYSGDYDYSQKVDADDYFAIDSNYNKAATALILPAAPVTPVVMSAAGASELPSAATSGSTSEDRTLLDELL